MKYYDIHITAKDDCKEDYSVFVEASDKNEAVQIMTDNYLYKETEDLDNIDYINEITKEEYIEAKTHDKLENYISPEGRYIIPVTFEMYSTVKVTGVKNLKEAVELVKKNSDYIPLGEGDYIDGSYKVSIDNDYDAIVAQDYSHIGDVEISPEDFIVKKEEE